MSLPKFGGERNGAIAKPDDVFFTADLPKTRSAKVMRRLLRNIAEGRVLGDTTRLTDPKVIEEIRERYVAEGKAVAT